MVLVKRFNNQTPDLANIFDDFFGSDSFISPFAPGRRSMPAVNVRETNDDYVIEVAAPGLSREDFKVEVNNSVLTISSEKSEKKESEDKSYTRREFSFSSFQRSFALPRNEVDESKISASYKDGILSISLRKREEVKPKPAKMIEIK